ncbi:MAG: inositol phosphorylceramide synthase [Deltaproteobacteria bacterium]|nr:inositol phosphorylceramide synthase [Deltaproteobacteria bacterium]
MSDLALKATPSATPGRPRLWRRLAARVQPQYLLLLLFGGLLALLHAFAPQRLSFNIMSVRYALWMMLSFAAAALVVELFHATRGRPRTVREALARSAAMLRDWFPFVLCLWVYENLHDLTHWLRPDTVDEALARADGWLFGAQPTLWLEQWAHPLLTDWMALAYLTYFVFPPLLAGWLYFAGHTGAFRELQLGLLVAFYGGFIGYILVPAVGPQLILAGQYRGPLTGRYVYWGAKVLVTTLQTFPRDCFPSLHTAISTVTLLFLLRHRRSVPLRPVVLPAVTLLTVSLWVSTVYLRYHWFVDVLAGFALALLATLSGIAFERRWPRPAPARCVDAPRHAGIMPPHC